MSYLVIVLPRFYLVFNSFTGFDKVLRCFLLDVARFCWVVFTGFCYRNGTRSSRVFMAFFCWCFLRFIVRHQRLERQLRCNWIELSSKLISIVAWENGCRRKSAVCPKKNNNKRIQKFVCPTCHGDDQMVTFFFFSTVGSSRDLPGFSTEFPIAATVSASVIFLPPPLHSRILKNRLSTVGPFQYRFTNGISMGPPSSNSIAESIWVLLGFTGLNLIEIGLTAFDWVWMGLTGFLLAFTRF